MQNFLQLYDSIKMLYQKYFVSLLEMKQWIYIMIVYLLGLAVQPCADTDFFVSERSLAQSESFDGHHDEGQTHHHDPNEVHECNPLCLCACCGVQVLPMSVANPLQPKSQTHYRKLFIAKTSQLQAKYINDIWQPPQPSFC